MYSSQRRGWGRKQLTTTKPAGGSEKPSPWRLICDCWREWGTEELNARLWGNRVEGGIAFGVALFGRNDKGCGQALADVIATASCKPGVVFDIDEVPLDRVGRTPIAAIRP